MVALREGAVSYERGTPVVQKPRTTPSEHSPLLLPERCRADLARIRHSRPDSGLGFQIKALTTFKVAPFRLGSGPAPQQFEAAGSPPEALCGGISKVNFQETLSSFGDKYPQNGSKKGLEPAWDTPT